MLPNFTIVNDEVALETVEAYNITLVSASPSKNVILGRDSLIMITDEDGKLCIIFLIQKYTKTI